MYPRTWAQNVLWCHKVVTLKKCIFTLECSKRRKKLCEVYCELCDIPTCVQCASSGEHMGHQQVDIDLSYICFMKYFFC